MDRLPETIRRRLTRWFPTRRRVDFLICGVQKGGTTALAAYLREHDQVCMAETKEVHFFDDDARFESGDPDYPEYHARFAPRRHHRVMGEATPIYLYWRPAPERIQAYNPDMKLVALLRNPIERAYSHWNMERSRGADPLPFWDAITTEEARCREGGSDQHRVYSYIDRGRYVRQLKRLWARFPRENVLLLKSSELRRRPRAVLDPVCDFLGIRRFEHLRPREVNARSYESPMSPRARRYLHGIFEDEIRALESLLDWDCSDWLEAPGPPTAP